MSDTGEKILIVDDEADVLRAEKLALHLAGLRHVITCSDSRRVQEIVERDRCGIVVLDLIMPGLGGEELQERLAEHCPDVTVIVLTGVNDIQSAVDCMKRGAFDYITKPIDPPRLVSAVRNALRHRSAVNESQRLREELLFEALGGGPAFEDIITRCGRMRNIFRYLSALAPTRRPILLCGETGVGKELFAKAIHRASKLKGDFVCVNCAGIDDQLFSDTLFGHTSDAYTGASRERPGLIRRAAGGTLFLDEIGDLSGESQIKLLRLLQEGTYYKLGSDAPEQSDARIVAATNADLVQAQEAGTFRRDLFYRLQSHQVNIPPLRQRPEDIPLLLEHFLEQAAEEMKKTVPQASSDLIHLLESHGFPGNVRELQGMVYNAVGLYDGGPLPCSTFQEAIDRTSGTTRPPHASDLPQGDTPAQHLVSGALTFPDPLPTAREVEEALVLEALRRAGGNKTLAASMLGMTRKTLRSKLPND